MTTSSTTRAFETPVGTGGSITDMIIRRYRARRNRRLARRAMGELRALNNHTLKDIGMHRSEVISVVCADPTGRRRRYAGN